MASYNKVILIGRLTKDPELKTTPSGISVLSGSVAVDRAYKQGDERKTDFIEFITWRKTAEFVAKYFKKGSAILLEGELQARSYTAQDGSKHKVVEVIASNVAFVETKASAAQAGQGVTPEAQITRYGEANDSGLTPVDESSFTTIENEDDLPF